MKSIILVGVAGIIAITGLGIGLTTDKIQLKNVTPAVSAKSLSDLPKGAVKEYKIQAGDTFAEVMTEQGVPYNDALSILQSAKNVFDFTTVGAGKLLKLVFINEAFAAMEYQVNGDSVIHVKKEGSEFTATEENIPYQIEQVTAAGTINDSLFMAAKNAGIEDKIILAMADAFSWEIDFATDIRSGDSFSVVYEKRTLNGAPASAGKLLAAKFTNEGKIRTIYAYNGKYYDESGKSVTRQFLRSPLSYSYISSGYSNSRVNPVTRKVQTHFAIDYAADAGTPIMATAKGDVSYAATKGGLGITVEIKHGGSYITQYAHMSKIAKGIKNGMSVEQGDVIGYVGSTGISTGPHLQYALSKGGEKLNPLTLVSPEGESIAESDKVGLEKAMNKLQDLLN